MIKKSLLAGLAVLAFGCMTLANAKSWVGTVSDSNCKAKHAQADRLLLARPTREQHGGFVAHLQLK